MKNNDSNKLVADFMGLSVSFAMGEWCCAEWDGLQPVKYHDDWNCLMTVVERIEATRASLYFAFTVVISGEYCSIKCHEKNSQDGIIYQTPYGTTPESKMVAVYEAIVEYIKWYNKII